MAQAKPAAAPETALPAPFYFRQLGGRFLATNDAGNWVWLDPAQLRKLAAGRVNLKTPLGRELQTKGFVRDRMDFALLAQAYRQRNAFLWQGPSLHILIVTLRCNHKCVYCHSSAVDTRQTDTDMSLGTARAAVARAMQSPSSKIVIEFQGGEPLLNWPAVRAAVLHAESLNRHAKKDLQISIVTNFSLLDEKKLGFLLDHEVSLCTSLDGPRDLHERNRVYLPGSSHALTTRWLRRLMTLARTAQSPQRRIFQPSALLTITRFSLGRWKDIVDEYTALGLGDVFFRPLAPIGYAKRVWTRIGYSAAQFLKFYASGLDYILAQNRRGVPVAERTAVLFLEKILAGRDCGFVDLRSPCGAALGQLAYNHDGDIYTCDEGRMVAHQGDSIFKLGHVARGTYEGLIDSPACRTLCMASNLESQAACSRCAYKPFCGICPVHNYEAQGSLWGHMPTSDWCAIHMGILDLLFQRLTRPADRKIFDAWLVRRKKP